MKKKRDVLELGLSDRALGCLEQVGISTLEELASIDLGKLNKICFMNQNTVNEIVKKCKKIGILFEVKENIFDKYAFFEDELFLDDEKGERFIFSDDTYSYDLFTARYVRGKEPYYELELDEFMEMAFNEDSDIYQYIVPDKNYLEQYVSKNFVSNYVIDDVEYFIKQELIKAFEFDDNYDLDDSYKVIREISKEVDNFIRKHFEEIVEIYNKSINNKLNNNADKVRGKAINNIDRIVLFIKNELKELKKTKKKKKTLELEDFLVELREFPDKFVESAKMSCKSNAEDFAESDLEYYESYEFAEKYYSNMKKPNVNDINACISLDDVFNLIPQEYINTELYDSYNPLLGDYNTPFISNFVKLCSKICKKEDGNLYDRKEIIQFLVNKLNHFNKKLINDVDEFVNIGYFDDIDFTQPIDFGGRKGRR